MQLSDKILITGGTGLVGSALQEVLTTAGYTNVFALRRKDCDLIQYDKTVRS